MFNILANMFIPKENHPLIRLAENEYGPEFRRIQKMIGRRPSLSDVEHLFKKN